MVSDGLFATSKRDELAALMKRFDKAQALPQARWTEKLYAEYRRIIQRIEDLTEQLEKGW